MKKKAVASIVSLFVLFLVATFFTSLVSAPLPELPTPIYIRNDGSVEPATAPLQRIGSTYTFTDKINNTIEVQSSNILIDGNGFVLTKPAVNTEGLMMPIGWLPGVHVVDISNITITNIAFEGCITGITVENASSITISQNTIRETTSGIVVLSSSEINIIGNNITLPNQSFATGIHFLPSNPDATDPFHITIRGNRIIGTSTQVPASPPQPEQYGIWGGFGNSQMTGNSLSEIKGIALYYTGSNNLISSNNFQNNYEGILFTGSPEFSVNNTIYGNNFNHNSENAVVPYIRDQPLNFWDNGTVGNYWSDYTGADNSGDGIGDTPYEIAVNNIDNYPLMTQISLTPEFQWWIAMPPLVGALLLTRFITRKKTSSKKRTLLVTLLLMPLILVSLGFSINLVHGNFVVPPIPPLTITIQLPENNEVYTENSIPVAFAVQRTYERVYMLEKPDSYTYTLDGKEGVFTPSQISTETDYYLCVWALSGLSEGTHRLVISVQYAYYFTVGSTTAGPYRTSGYASTVFTINAAAPRVSIVSIKQLKTYNTTTLPLDFTVSEPASWLGYSLDGEASVPITGNTTLSGLSDGTHTIVVQAEDSTGSVGASAPVTFTVETQTAGQQTGSESSPFPTTLITVGITVAIGAIISIGLVVYSLRRKRKSGET